MVHATLDMQTTGARCESLMLAPNGWVPNNTHLPVLIWHGALDPHKEAVWLNDALRREVA